MAYPNDSDTDEANAVVQRAITTALKPVEVLTSRSAVKAYLSTLLFVLTSLSLLGLSTVAFAFFYYNYIPQINVERPIYLQYGLGSHPHATTFLDTNALISSQPYDIELILHMPRTPPNLAAGNFMLDLALLSQGPPLANKLSESLAPIPPNISTGHNLLHHSRRPAIIPYSSPILSVSHTLLNLPWHFLRLRDLDSVHLTVPMFEMLSFSRGYRNVPTHVRVELQAQLPPPPQPISFNPFSSSQSLAQQSPQQAELQVYSLQIAFHARYQGLRYMIYNHRVLAFFAFSTIFYFTSILSMGLAWTFFSSYFSPQSPQDSLRLKIEPSSISDGNKKIKREGEEADSNGDIGPSRRIKQEEDDESDDFTGLSLSNLSDNAAQFPSGRGQMPLRYAGRTPSTSAQAVPDPIASGGVRGTDEAADDEDDDDEHYGEGRATGRDGVGDRKDGDRRFEDSGIGTSLESENIPSASGTGAGVRRRGSRGNSSR